MKQYRFTIQGNQEDASGNPIPYYRSTQRSFFNKGSRRYHAWKDFVRASFMNQCNVRDVDMKEIKPIKLGENEEAEMVINIFWKNKAHSDADNVFKGIADALFVNDKNIWYGCFRAFPSDDKRGRVEVLIKITEKA